MPGIDRATGRVVAVIALVVLAGIALRGHVPAANAAAEQPSNGPGALVGVVALLGTSMVIIVLAFVAALRRPRQVRPAGGEVALRAVGERGPLPWRVVLIGLGVILAWLLLVVLLLRFSALYDAGRAPAGSTVSTPATPPAAPSAPPPDPAVPPQTNGDVFWYLFATTVVLFVLLGVAMVIALRRRPRAALAVASGPAAPSSDPDAPDPLALAAERGLAEMGDLSREPREAIIACYAAMEEALATAPGAAPLDSDTPSEVLERAVAHHAIQAGSATELVELFAEARFSPHVMNETHREVAVRALRRVLDQLRSLV